MPYSTSIMAVRTWSCFVPFLRCLLVLAASLMIEACTESDMASFNDAVGLEELHQGYVDLAIARFGAAIARNPNDVAAYNNRSFAYAAIGQNTLALEAV